MVECDQCGATVDPYVEFEPNLKLLQVMLCRPQIYRHIFYNGGMERGKQWKLSLGLPLFYLLVIYWYRNRAKYS